jgi:GT2 family glycosyltransferase
MEFAEWRQIRHVPVVLYHWRAIAGSAALNISYKRYAIEAGRAALVEHLTRRQISAKVSAAYETMYQVRYSVREPPPFVSIIIPIRGKHHLLRGCVDSIRRLTHYGNYEILVVDNGSLAPETVDLLNEYRRTPGMRVLSFGGPFNYSAINNFAVANTRAEFVCLLNNDTQVITPDWLSEMVGYGIQPGVGCVGAKLLYENGTVQHAGVVLGIGGVAGHAFLGRPEHDTGYFGRAVVTGNWSALTGACLLVQRLTYLAIGGLDERALPVAFNDIDFCIKISKAGLRNVLAAHAKLYHFESLSRGREDTLEKSERFQREGLRMKARHGRTLLEDPYYSPHLDRCEDFSIRTSKPN